MYLELPWLRPTAVSRDILFCVLLLCAGESVVANAGVFELTVTDESGKPVPCRVSVRAPGGEGFAPEGATQLEFGPNRWFISSGHSKLEVPEREILLRIERGPEYVRIKESMRILGDTSKTVQLHRWVNMERRGYLCGENHLHVETKKLAPMLVAEGLDFGTSLTWWRGPDSERPIPAGAGPVRPLTFAGQTVPTSIHDAELEYDWGAAYILHLPLPMPLEAESKRPNLDYLRHAVEAGALVHYQGGYSREVGLDALVGCVHVINVCNNNFALHRFQPRSRYSNLLEVPDFPIYPDTDAGMMRMNTDTYYRLLNWGLRLAAGAGTATGVKKAPVGYNRAYVRAEPNATIEQFYAAWKRGENFVTNGPMLFLKTEAGQRPGDTFQLPVQGGKVRVQVEALADQPLTAVEVVVNGQVAASLEVQDPNRAHGSVSLDIERGSWIAARVTARDDWLSDQELATYDDHRDRKQKQFAPSRLRFAHTSPIYVEVGGQGCALPDSIHEGLRMLDRFEAYASENSRSTYQPTLDAALRQARQTLQARMGLALFGRENLVAWCIVPFDRAKRGPAARAEMLQRLGIRKVAYDWRAEHVATFEEEILEYKKHQLEFFAFWSWHPAMEPLIRKYGIHPQIWLTNPSPEGPSQEARVRAASEQLLPLVQKAKKLGLRLGLYNHGGWGGEPANLVAVCQYLRGHHHAEHVGIVYNFHHGHEHIENFAEVLAAMVPYLYCLNVNGMAEPQAVAGDTHKILAIGSGTHEEKMLATVLGSGYHGPIGILDHRPALDAEQSLQENITGLQKLVAHWKEAAK
jgi:hypothetical protein